MAKTLRLTVHVPNEETGVREVFLAGSEPPAWARKAITNPDVWDDGDDDGEDDEPVDLTTEEGLTSLTVDELKVHATASSIDLGGATKKADIVAAILAAPTGDGGDDGEGDGGSTA